MKKAIVTGVTGQLGSYFVEFLLDSRDYEVFGTVRRLSVKNDENIRHLYGHPHFKVISMDLTDGPSIQNAIETIKPDYFINCAAQSFVQESWNSPVNTFQTDCISIIYMLEAIRKVVPHCRFLNCGSSEQFGDIQYSPQDINHPFRSRSPYGCAKVASGQLIKVYRESYGLYCIQPIFYNYESKRRGEDFLTQKVARGVARIRKAIDKKQSFEPIKVGNLNVERDWGHAIDVVDAAWMMLNQEVYSSTPWPLYVEQNAEAKAYSKQIKEYIVATGKTHTARQFIERAFFAAGILGKWKGEFLEETYVHGNGVALVSVDPSFYRPSEVNTLCGDSTPIRTDFGWKPRYSFEEIVDEMVGAALERE